MPLTQREEGPVPVTKRSWWPAAVGIGLGAAALVGLLAYRVVRDDPAAEPADATTTVPLTVPPASVVPDDSSGSTVEPTSTDVTEVPTSSPTTGGSAEVGGNVCVSPLPVDERTTLESMKVPTGAQIDVVVCRDHADGASGIYVVRPAEGSGDPTEYFASASPFAPVGVPLTGPTAIEGVPGVEYFVGQIQDGVDCVLLVVSAANDWREMCFQPGEGAPGPIFTVINGKMTEFDVTDPSAPTGHVLDGQVWGSSGCSYDDAESVIAASHGRLPMLALTGVRCEGERSSLRAGSVLLQPGPVDGLIEIYERAGTEWTLVDAGTGIEEFFPHDVPPFETWSTWPAATNPVISAIDFGPTSEPATTDIDEMANRLLAEFTASVGGDRRAEGRVVDVIWRSEPLVVLDAEIVDDDSVSGQIAYVWLRADVAETGLTGFTVDTVYEAFRCGRGITSDGDLCI